jgi:Fe-S oxidoreductase
VPQPTCAYTLKDEYPSFLGTDAAAKVAAATVDASEFLMARHREAPLDTNFDGTTYESIVWQAACHYRAQQIGPKSSQLMQLTGAKVQVVERCTAIDGTWGLRAENVELARRVAKPLMDRIKESDAELVAGDCQLANVAIHEGSGKRPIHPMQVIARAYGIEEEGSP